MNPYDYSQGSYRPQDKHMNASSFHTFCRQDPVLNAAIERMIAAANRMENKLTRDQFVQCMWQALQCGDFIRMIAPDHRFGMIYLPFAEKEKLLSHIQHLETQLRVNGIEPIPYPPPYES